MTLSSPEMGKVEVAGFGWKTRNSILKVKFKESIRFQSGDAE